jgi:hypothetical protein
VRDAGERGFGCILELHARETIGHAGTRIANRDFWGIAPGIGEEACRILEADQLL